MRKFRFAPSPNGFLHLGHAYSALLNRAQADACGGTLLLRMEDIDFTRCRDDYIAAILEDMDWLGVRFDGEMLLQSDFYSHHIKALLKLDEMGLVYPCRKSRKDIEDKVLSLEAEQGRSWPRDPDGGLVYPFSRGGNSRAFLDNVGELPKGVAYRLDMKAAVKTLQANGFLFDWQEGEERVSFDPMQWGDVVLARKDIGNSYHLACVVDDDYSAISDVVRGRDLYHASAIHRILQGLLGFKAPRYFHHKLLMDDDFSKLSKSKGAQSLRDLRANGVRAQEVRSSLGF